MSEEKWGPGDLSEAKPFGTAKMGSADTPQERVELLWGEAPHSRNDNRLYARLPGGHITGFDGHRILIDISIKSRNYLKDSEYSGDEIRKGGSCVISADGIEVYEFFFRDPMWALLRAHQLVGQLSEHSSGWLSVEDRARLIGRRVYYERDPARIVRLIEDQGCLILEPDGVDRFASPVWREDGDDWDEYDRSVKVEVTDPKIWWFRNEDR